MKSVTVQEAKTHLSRLLRDVEGGEQVEIRRGNVPVAVLSRSQPRIPFRELRDKYPEIEIPEDFDELDQEEAQAFGMIE